MSLHLEVILQENQNGLLLRIKNFFFAVLSLKIHFFLCEMKNDIFFTTFDWISEKIRKIIGTNPIKNTMEYVTIKIIDFFPFPLFFEQ